MIFLVIPGVVLLELEQLIVPSHSLKNDSVVMQCHYKLGDETLYSVKWYKDGNEFYRYVPRNSPPTQVFPLAGVTVDVSENFYKKCVLKKKRLGWSEHPYLHHFQLNHHGVLENPIAHNLRNRSTYKLWQNCCEKLDNNSLVEPNLGKLCKGNLFIIHPKKQDQSNNVKEKRKDLYFTL